MSLNSLQRSMPASQSVLPSRLSQGPASVMTATPTAHSNSGSSSSSLRAARRQLASAPIINATASEQVDSRASDFAASRATARTHAGAIYASPATVFILGVPITVFATTCISMGLNLISIVLLLTANCSFDLYQVRHMFGFLLVAQFALGSMLLVNIYYHHYRYNCLSLSFSFLFSGSAALLIFGLVETLVGGLCRPSETPEGSLMISKYPANYVIWFMTVVSVTSQLVAHYYYG